MTPVKCDQCGKLVTTNFCPDCGRKREDIKVIEPFRITTYLHGDKEDGLELCKKHGIDPKSEFGQKLIYLNYEVRLDYEIRNDEIKLVFVDSGNGKAKEPQH